jgi:hypothetical protein
LFLKKFLISSELKKKKKNNIMGNIMPIILTFVAKAQKKESINKFKILKF